MFIVYACDTCSTHFYIIAVQGCSFVYLRNCIFCPLSLAVMFIVYACDSGAFVVILRGQWNTLLGMSFAPGDILMMGAVILYALYSALLRQRPAIHPLSFLIYTFGLGIIFLLPLYIWELAGSQSMTLTYPVILSILYVALFPSIVAYFCWNRGVEVLGANRTGLFINLIPVFASILAILFLGETLQTFHIVGMVLIFSGMILFNR